MSNYYSIGFTRDDGDLELFATLNNGNELLSELDFQNLAYIIQDYVSDFSDLMECVIELHERQDAPDIVQIEELE